LPLIFLDFQRFPATLGKSMQNEGDDEGEAMLLAGNISQAPKP
jgi:hypothetical protein